MQDLVNSLASHEVHVARYYYNRGAYVATINCAQAAITNFPQAPANEEALFLLVKSYDALGMTQLRDDADRVMRTNFPNSVYQRRTEERQALGGSSGEQVLTNQAGCSKAPSGAPFVAVGSQRCCDTDQ